MSHPLDNLSGPGKQLKAEAPDAAEIAGLLRTGERRCRQGADNFMANFKLSVSIVDDAKAACRHSSSPVRSSSAASAPARARRAHRTARHRAWPCRVARPSSSRTRYLIRPGI